MHPLFNIHYNILLSLKAKTDEFILSYAYFSNILIILAHIKIVLNNIYNSYNTVDFFRKY